LDIILKELCQGISSRS